MKRTRTAAIVGAALAAMSLALVTAAASGGASTRGLSSAATVQTLKRTGVGKLSSSPTAVTGDPTEALATEIGSEAQNVEPEVPNKGRNTSNLPRPGIPSAASSPLAGSDALLSVNGLTHADQRLAGTGAYTNTQFSTEPPDQGLCTGNGDVLEVVNAALRVRSASTGHG